ncbi:MAG: HAMP domain-containing histidine kinase [Lachnospiraceae bacterium]|nr:HAMP domain-containing histidine kinase [Lachnospiraceae bacterium]
MRYRYRLMAGFLIVLFLPILLIALLGMIFFNSQRDRLEEIYKIEMDRQGYLSAESVSGICDMAGKSVALEFEVNSGRFLCSRDEDSGDLNKYNLYLMKNMNCFLIKINISDSWYYYGGTRVTDALVAEIKSASRQDKVQYFADENLFFKVVNTDPESQKKYGIIVVATYGDQQSPEFKEFLKLLVASVILVLFVTALITATIARSMIQPIREVQKASRKVRDGDLDYELDIQDKEFKPLCDDFNQMRLRLKESEKIKAEADAENQELISNISHDLKTPLTAIKGYVEGLLDNIADTPERRERYLTTIYNKTNDMQRLIDELTFYSRIDTNRIPYNFVPLPIADFFRDCVDETELDLTSRGMKLEFACEVEDNILVKADPEQMRRVLNNIIGNSVKYMDKPQGVVGIHLWRDDRKVYAELMDNGPGISEDALPYIFDRFYRADAARSQNQAGSGIGLSIVQKVVEDHGGTVYATSTLGEGTKITIELNIYNEDEDREDEEDIDR